MGILIWISVGVFLLLPYYLRIFILDDKKIRIHITFWIFVHFMMSIVSYCIEKEIFSVAMVLLIVYSVYYFFSYIFYVRNIVMLLDNSSMEGVVKSKFFNLTRNSILCICGIMLILDSVLIWEGVQEIYNQVYLFLVIFISYLQCYSYFKEYEKKFKEDLEYLV